MYNVHVTHTCTGIHEYVLMYTCTLYFNTCTVYIMCISLFLDKYDDFIACAQNGGDIQSKTARMKQLVKELPPCHYHTLGFLIKHLTNIAAHHQVSKVQYCA